MSRLLITGAGRGIDRALATTALARGWEVTGNTRGAHPKAPQSGGSGWKMAMRRSFGPKALPPTSRAFF